MRVSRRHVVSFSALSRLLPQLLRAALGIAVVAIAAGRAPAQETTGTVTGRSRRSTATRRWRASTVFVTGTQTGALTRNDGTYRVALRPGRYELRVRLHRLDRHARQRHRRRRPDDHEGLLARASPTTLEALAIVGTRGEARTVMESPVPIDVLTAADIAPPVARRRIRSFRCSRRRSTSRGRRSPTAPITCGRRHCAGSGRIRCSCSINGKRRHNSALVNVNGTVGRGSTGVDLNAIPASHDRADRGAARRRRRAVRVGRDRGRHQHRAQGQRARRSSPATFGQTAEGDGQVAHSPSNAGSVFGQTGLLPRSASSIAIAGSRTARGSIRGRSTSPATRATA